MRTLPRQERIARWVLISIAVVLASWGLFEFIHDDYRPPKEPTDPYDIEAKRFAHSIKLPDSVPTANYYPWWLGQDRYFEFLCEHEAGEWIFKTVDNVEGVFQMRPRNVATTRSSRTGSRWRIRTDISMGKQNLFFTSSLDPFTSYRYLETPLSPKQANVVKRVTRVNQPEIPPPFWRYTGEPRMDPVILAEAIDRPKSRYGLYVARHPATARPRARHRGRRADRPRSSNSGRPGSTTELRANGPGARCS